MVQWAAVEGTLLFALYEDVRVRVKWKKAIEAVEVTVLNAIHTTYIVAIESDHDSRESYLDSDAKPRSQPLLTKVPQGRSVKRRIQKGDLRRQNRQK